jgi:methyl-accepting chemotaxis protein
MSREASLAIIAICQLIATVAIVVAAAGVIALIFCFKRMVNRKIDEILGRVQPIIDEAKAITEQARQTAEKLSDKVDSIMTKAEDTASKVTDRMDSVSAKVAEAVSPQAATFAGYATAAVKAFRLFQQLVSAKQSAKPSRDKEPD